VEGMRDTARPALSIPSLDKSSVDLMEEEDVGDSRSYKGKGNTDNSSQKTTTATSTVERDSKKVIHRLCKKENSFENQDSPTGI